MIFGLLYFCVVILCVNRSRTSFILYRIVKRHSRQSNVRRIWTCADNGKENDFFSDGLYIFKVAVSLNCFIRFQGHFGQAHLGQDNSVHFFNLGPLGPFFWEGSAYQ